MPPPGWPKLPPPGSDADLHLALGRGDPLAELLEPGPLTSILGLPALQLAQLPLALTQLGPHALGLLLQLPDALAVLAVQGLGRLPWGERGGAASAQAAPLPTRTVCPTLWGGSSTLGVSPSLCTTSTIIYSMFLL